LPYNSIPILVNLIGYSYISYEFNRMPKRKIKHIPLHLQDTDKARKAISWAFRSYLRAYPVPSGDMYHIIVDNGVKRLKSPQTYNKEELTEAIWNIYIKYYDNHLEKVGYES